MTASCGDASGECRMWTITDVSVSTISGSLSRSAFIAAKAVFNPDFPDGR
jgi:hypothetical protein